MIKRIWTLLLFMVISLSSLAQVSFYIDAPKVVETDESFRVVFIANADPTSFEQPEIEGFSILAGPTSSRMSSTQIINGKKSESYEVSYTYVLQALNEGKFTISPATVVVNGKRYSTKPFVIEVVKASGETKREAVAGQSGVGSNDLMLKFSLSKSRVVKGEPITATLKLYTKVPIAGFEDVKFPSFNGFWSQEVEASQNIEFVRENVNGTIYNSAVLKRYILIPQQTGQLDIESSELVCIVQLRGESRASRSIFDDFFTDYQTIRKRITAPSNRVTVLPLPAGAPKSFNGAVGEFSMDARLTRDTLNANEVFSLIVKIWGTGNINLVEPPKVNFPVDFESYDIKTTDRSAGGTARLSGTKEYEFPLIPRGAGSFSIDPIEFSYYDINKRSYITLTSSELNVKVGADINGGSALVGHLPVTGVNKQAVKSLDHDIRYINTQSGGLTKSSPLFFGTLLYILLMMGIAVVWFVIRIVLDRYIERNRDVAGVRNRKAEKVAKGRLRVAESLLKKRLHIAFYEELYKALLGYVSDKYTISQSDLSSTKIEQAFLANGVDGDISKEFFELISGCEYARFAPDSGEGEVESTYNRAMSLITVLERGKIKRYKRKMKQYIIAALIFLSSLNAAAQSDNLSILWAEANENYATSNFEDALEGYLKLSEEGYLSANLFYNIGNSYYKLGQMGKAILFYERSLKLDPSNSDAQNNLNLVKSLILDKIEILPEFIVTSWIRDLNYSLSSNGWAVLSLLLMSLFAFLMLLFRYASTSTIRKLTFFSALFVLIMGFASILFARSQKNDFLKHNQAIVMKPVSSIKSSPDNTGKTLFILHEGTKVKLYEKIGGWQRVELSDGRQGWISSPDMEII